MGAERFQGMQNNIQHCLGFLKHLVIPESEHAISLRFDSTVATLCNGTTHGLDYRIFCPSPTLPRATRKGGSLQCSLLKVVPFGSGFV